MSGDSLDLDDGSDAADEAASYRAVSHWAVLSLIFGASSALVLVHPLLAFLPALAVICGAAALRQIKHYWPTYVGRSAALLGLWLALVFAVAMPTRLLIWHFQIEAEAIRFGDEFMRLLLEDRPIEAHQLTLPIKLRLPPDETMLETYRSDPTRADGVRSFVREPTLRTLLALGSRAKARLYEVESLTTNGESAAGVLLYAISFEDNGTLRTFFVRLILVREVRPTERTNWKVYEVLGDVYPGEQRSMTGHPAPA